MKEAQRFQDMIEKDDMLKQFVITYLKDYSSFDEKNKKFRDVLAVLECFQENHVTFCGQCDNYKKNNGDHCIKWDLIQFIKGGFTFKTKSKAQRHKIN